MEKENKIRKNTEYKEVYACGQSKVNQYLVMYVKKNNKKVTRLGISVSKKVGNSVIRHKITRLIRESYRLNQEQFKYGYDIVVVARNSSKCCQYFEIESALLHLAKLCKVKKNKNESCQVENE